MLSALVDPVSIGLSIDDAGRIVLATAPDDLAQSGIVAGTIITFIDEQPAAAFLAAAFQKGGEILSRKPRVWSFIVGDQTVRVALALIESQAPPGEVIRVRLTCEGYADGGVAIDIDTGARTVVLGEVPANLAQIDVAVGAVCVAIDDQPPFEVLESDVGVPAGVALPWDFTAGVRSARLMLIFRNENGEYAPVGASVSDAANRRSANSFHKGGIIERPGFVTGIPFSDHSYHERPPRKVSVEYVGSWGQNMGPDVDPASRNDGRSFTPPKQRAPLYD